MDEFDLKKFLAEASAIEEEKLKELILSDGLREASGLNEYLSDIHHSGAKIIANYVQGSEVSHLIAIIAGISAAEILFSPIEGHNVEPLMELIAKNTDLVHALTLSIMCATVGLVCREEWR